MNMPPVVGPGSEPDANEQNDAIIARRFWQSVAVFSILGGSVLVGAILMQRAPPPPANVTTESKQAQVRVTDKAEIPQLTFTDITAASGITFQHTTGATGEKLLPETMGSGCAFFDYDNDGDQDLLFVNGTSWPWTKTPIKGPVPTLELYQNDGSGQFKNVTAETGLALTQYGMGVACGDYDGDGWCDLYITNVGQNRLLRNAQGKFVDVTEAAGVAGSENDWSTSATFFDMDRDGDLDLFVANYVRWSREIDLTFDFRLVGLGRAYGPPTSFAGAFPLLFRNEGNGKFVDVSEPAGVQVKNAATNVPVGKSMGVVPVDVDGDGYLDLVVANDTVQNFVFLNQRNGTFTEIGYQSGVAIDSSGLARGAMGIDAARFRNDKTLGLVIGNFANEMTALYCATDNQPLFTDDAIATGLGPPTRQELTFGVLFIDCDLDSRLDILATNGHLEHEINQVQSSQHHAQAPHLIWNAGAQQTSEFVSVPAEKCGSDFMKPMVGRGSAMADIDGDGDLDVVLAANGGTPRLLRNDQATGHHWLRFKLQGSGKNRDAIGAKITVKLGDHVIERTVMPTKSYCSQSELPVTIGLGSLDTVSEASITWPNGTVSKVPLTKVDTLVTVQQ